MIAAAAVETFGVSVRRIQSKNLKDCVTEIDFHHESFKITFFLYFHVFFRH